MLMQSQGMRILVATKPVDFRKGHDGLVALAQAMLAEDPLTGTVFVFRAKRADRLKILFWNGSGLVMAYKRLEARQLLLASGSGRGDDLEPNPNICVPQVCRRRDPSTGSRIPDRGGVRPPRAPSHISSRAKYADHLPLYRQILARAGIELQRSTLANWVGTAAFHFGPVVDRLTEHLKTSSKLFMEFAGAVALVGPREPRRTQQPLFWAPG